MVSLCAFTAAQGWSVVDFARARATGDDSAGPHAWIGVPAVTEAGVVQELAGQNGTAAERRMALLTQLLAARPMSATAWLSLAGMRVATGKPYKDVLAALKMSSITGPNEADVMWQRGIFCVLQWEALPPEFQEHAIADLAGPILTGIVNARGRQLIRGVLGAKTPQTRARIASLLQMHGVTPEDLAKIGLVAVQPPTAGR